MYLCEQFSQNFLSIIYHIISRTLDEKMQQAQNGHNQTFQDPMYIKENDSKIPKTAYTERNVVLRTEENTRSSNHDNDDHFYDYRVSTQQSKDDIPHESPSKPGIPTSSAYIAKKYSQNIKSRDKLKDLGNQNNGDFVTVNAVTASDNFDPEFEIQNFYNYSKTKRESADISNFNNNPSMYGKPPSRPKHTSKNGNKENDYVNTKMNRHASMGKISQEQFDYPNAPIQSLRNIVSKFVVSSKIKSKVISCFLILCGV